MPSRVPLVAPHTQPGCERSCRPNRFFSQRTSNLLPVRHRSTFLLSVRLSLRSAKIPSATQTTVTGLQWFKIYQDGYDPSTGKWAVDTLIANKGKVSFTIPSCIASGQYLLRHEIIGMTLARRPRLTADRLLIALHAASSYPGAQLYMECAQIQITGGGSKQPATVSFPGAYHSSDPGITINIYEPLKNYTIPGMLIYWSRYSTLILV